MPDLSRPMWRRGFLRFGTLAALGHSPCAAAAREPSFGRAKRYILLFLTGGPPQLDTFDPKPDAPAQVRGELTTIPTRLPGVRFTELFPRLAAVNDRLCLVRSVTHRDTVHTSAGYTMLTGVDHPLANTTTATSIKETPNDHPHLGSLLSRYRPNSGPTPTFASLPEYIRDDQINDYPGQGGGLLGKSVDPFRLEANAARTAFEPPPIALPNDVPADRLAQRQHLRGQLNRVDSRANHDTEGYYRQSFDLIGSHRLQEAFDLDRESERLRASYGNHLFGRGCLMGRRLLQAGVALVTVYWHYEGPKDSPVWDTHGDNFPHLRKRLAAPTDHAVAALIADLDARGMLDDTLVICMGGVRAHAEDQFDGRPRSLARSPVHSAGRGRSSRGKRHRRHGSQRGVPDGRSNRAGRLDRDVPSPAGRERTAGIARPHGPAGAGLLGQAGCRSVGLIPASKKLVCRSSGNGT